ncbi:MAG: hypothetical protein CVV27_12210, partial [Candidatus Melainabacteria bacterium HGW-Melainabacteria-1]
MKLTHWIQVLMRTRRFGLLVLLLIWGLGVSLLVLDKRPLPRMGSQGARHSEPTRVHNLVQQHFAMRQENALVLVSAGVPPPQLLEQLRAYPDITLVREMPSRKGRHHLVYLQMDPNISVFEAESHVPRLRELLARSSASSGVKTWLTGQQAFLYDMGQAGKKDTARTEGLGLLLAFAVLVGCFGSLSAAALPIGLGITTLMGTQVMIRVLGLGTSQTSIILNSMVGLGLAIDYALFMVSRYREERSRHDMETALQIMLRHTGRTVLYSAAVMITALLILLIPDVDALRGTVMNLLLVVILAAANAVILLPLLLAFLDPWLDRPRWLSRWILRWHSENRWRLLARHVTGHPIRYALLSTAILLALAWPLGSIRLWEPMQTMAPAESQSLQGFEALAAEGWGGEVLPIQILIESPADQPLTSPEQIARLYALTTALEALPEVASVQGLVHPSEPLRNWQSLYGSLGALGAFAPQHPLLRSTPSGDLTLVHAHLHDIMDIPSAYRVLAWIQDYERAHPGLELSVGGIAARARGFTHEMYRHLPLMLVLIMVSILALLSVYLKSIVLPLKAGIMNFLPILSAFGILVWAFQWGGLIQSPGVTNIVPLTL